MNNFIFIFVLSILFSLDVSARKTSKYFLTANSHPAVGEAGTLFLIEPGFYYYPGNNDWIGETDKLLTASSQIGFVGLFDNRWSFQTYVGWKFIVPIFRRSLSEDELTNPIGGFADWGDISFSLAHSNKWGQGFFKWQITLAYNHVGDKGAKNLHEWIHQTIDNPPYDFSEYDITYKKEFPGGGIQLGYVTPTLSRFAPDISMYFAIGYNYNWILSDVYAQANLILNFSRYFLIGLEGQIIYQQKSDFHDNIKQIRNEWGLGMLIGRYYRPSIKWVSSYIEGDAYNQLYIIPINIQIPF